MCCFSGVVKEVSATRIFARMVSPGRQVLAYQMQLATDAEVAMILPIPVPPNSADDAVRFISLERYPTMFDALYKAFAPVPALGPGRAQANSYAPPLEVHTVGAFIASFVPRLADFTRLDARFRVPPGTLDRIPEYADWGFAVFQLGATRGTAQVHPMAFEFPTRERTRLFFPTVHVHDGAVHPEAEFAHRLYAQGIAGVRPFVTNRSNASTFVDAERTEGIIDPDQPVSVRELVGMHPNRDQWTALPDAV
ncbi:MAG: hypothetical protein H0T42_17470 [Deltaproteobacteria bacterium]|nr:hypothetical protein [Deltaproteobacteria bacterium]